MKYRIAIWGGAGFLVAGCWAIYFFLTTPAAMTSGDPIVTLAHLTCPISLLSFYPLRLPWVLLANATTYALIGLLLEALRRRLRQAG